MKDKEISIPDLGKLNMTAVPEWLSQLSNLILAHVMISGWPYVSLHTQQEST